MIARLSPPTRKGKTKGYTIWVVLGLSALIISSIIYIFYVFNSSKVPVIERINPTVGNPGESLHIFGSAFGENRDNSYVEFDGAAVVSESYLMWTDKEIIVKIPAYVESSLVKVITEGGQSNNIVYVSSSILPTSKGNSSSSVSGPTIEKISTESGEIGSVLTINGLNFGVNRQDSEVLFSWNGVSSLIPTEDSENVFVSPSESAGEYESWSDKVVRVRVPDGASSGSVCIRTQKGTSDHIYFQINNAPGRKEYYNKNTYAMSSFVTISRVAVNSPDSELYLWMPLPLETSLQRDVEVLNRSHETFLSVYKDISLYKLSNLVNDDLISITQDFLVKVYALKTEIDEAKIVSAPNPLPKLYSLYTDEDAIIPAKDPEIIKHAQSVIKKNKNPYRIAKLLLEDVLSNAKFNPSADSTVLEAMKGSHADAWTISRLYVALLRASGVPAIPVSGIVVDDNTVAIDHSWVEFYIYGLGWIPVDPVLASGSPINDFSSHLDSPMDYFCNMDDRHIAFSRSQRKLEQITPSGVTVSFEKKYSSQNIFEEASTSLSSYTSFWSDIEITGMY